MLLNIRKLKDRHALHISAAAWDRLSAVKKKKIGDMVSHEQLVSGMVDYCCSLMEIDKYDLKFFITPEKEDQ